MFWNVAEGKTEKKDEEEDLNAYWIALSERKDTGIWKRKH
jgi:hypothetical protein